MNDLKPCPFCGGKAEMYEMQYGTDGQYSVFGVFCVDDSNSELIGLSKYQHGHFIDNFPTEAEAAKAWNTRYHFGLEDEDYNILLGEIGIAKPERTCKVIGSYEYGERDELKAWVLSCGHEFEWNYKKPPNYCPKCGAKVVE